MAPPEGTNFDKAITQRSVHLPMAPLEKDRL